MLSRTLMLVSGYRPGSGGGTPTEPATIEYVDFNNITGGIDVGSTITGTGVSIGDAATGRRVVLLVIYYSSVAAAISSATIGGVSADIHVQQYTSNVNANAAIISAIVPTGTTATVVVNLSASATVNMWIASYRVMNTSGVVDTDSVQNANHSNSVSIDVEADGVLLVGGYCTGTSTNYTVANATEDFEEFLGSGDTGYGASATTASDVTGLSITVTRNGSTGLGFGGALVGASFR